MATSAEGVLRNLMVKRAVRAVCDRNVQQAYEILLVSVYCQWQMREEYLLRKAGQ